MNAQDHRNDEQHPREGELPSRHDAAELRRPAPVPPVATAEVDPRYARQTRLPQLGQQGQRRLAAARVAVIGAGGLGSPVLEYLAAAGVGTVTVIDPDVVETSNLHRQVIHADAAVGRSKAVVAAQRMTALNPRVNAHAVVDAVTVENALELLGGHHVVIDGTDNFPTRYLASDACEMLDTPLVWGSILAFSGQVSVFWADSGRGVTYRDLHPMPPRPGEVPSCAEAGVLGMLCGVIGSTMALEAVKLITGIGQPLLGRLAMFDALTTAWDELRIARDPQRPPVTQLEDLVITCGLPGAPVSAKQSAYLEDVEEALTSGARVIDIREHDEVAHGMVEGAEHIPMGHLLRSPAEHGELDGAILYCAAGTRSGNAQAALAREGIRVLSLDGGFEAVSGSGIATRRPR